VSNPKALTRIYFVSGAKLDVIETSAFICPATAPPWTATVTEPNGTKSWINLRAVERLEVLP
jgi:hypothetical protein